jgi:chromosome segregation ATPase
MTNLQQTITELLSERSDLQAHITSLQSSLDATKAELKLLDEGKALAASLEQTNKALESQLENAKEEISRLAAVEKQLENAQGRLDHLTLAKQTAEDSVNQVRLETAGEIASLKDSIGVIEKQLERARGREGGLEAEVGRLKQVSGRCSFVLDDIWLLQSNNQLSTSLTSTNTQLDSLKASSTTTESNLASLRQAHDDLQSGHTALTDERAKLQTSHETLQTILMSTEHSHKISQSQLSELTTNLESTRAELSSSKIELDKIRKDLAADRKKSEGVEKKRSALQEENAQLVAQLEEVRGRVVEVMEEKAILAGEVDGWVRRGGAWDREKEEWENERAELVASTEGTASTSKQAEDLQRQLDEALARMAEHESTITSLQTQLEAGAKASETNGTPNAVSSIAMPAPSSNDQETLSVLKAQHDSDLSAKLSKIRTLEEALHSSSTRVHALTHQLTELHSAYVTAQKERDDALSGAFSPRGVKGLFLSPAEEYGALSLSTNGNGDSGEMGMGGRYSPLPFVIPNNRSVDATLPPAVRHKRQLSLSALKARMGVEVRRVSAATAKMGVLAEESGSGEGEGGEGGGSLAGLYGLDILGKTPAVGLAQFGHEIMYCCPACEGDLITLWVVEVGVG